MHAFGPFVTHTNVHMRAHTHTNIQYVPFRPVACLRSSQHITGMATFLLVQQKRSLTVSPCVISPRLLPLQRKKLRLRVWAKSPHSLSWLLSRQVPMVRWNRDSLVLVSPSYFRVTISEVFCEGQGTPLDGGGHKMNQLLIILHSGG